MARRLIMAGWAIAAAMVWVERAFADEVRGVRCDSSLVNPVLSPGGVLFIPLDAERHGDRWPTHASVRFERGGSVEGTIVWMHLQGGIRDAHWTSPPAALALRPIMETDDSSSGLGAPHLVARIPANASGALRLLGSTLQPEWRQIPSDPFGDGPAGESTAVLERILAPDRPDPDSPFEYWRWVLLASRLGLAPPPPAGTEVEQLVAEYHAGIWLTGLGRLAEVSPGVARQCRDLLTAVCVDENQPLAAWVTDGDDLSGLLRILLDVQQPATALLDSALGWADTHDDILFFWLDPRGGEDVRLAMANAGTAERIVQFRWVYGDEALDAVQIPSAAVLPPGVVTRVTVDRPAPLPVSPLGATASSIPPQLEIQSERYRQRFAVRGGAIPAAPPGLYFGPLQPLLTLAQATASSLQPPPAERSTNVSFRRADGRWEVFVECFRPQGIGGAAAQPAEALERVLLPRDLRGVEAITVLVGDIDDPAATVSVAETGRPRVWVGGRESELQVHRRSFGDRWFCRIVLPDGWLIAPGRRVAMLGFMRTHGDSHAVETAPNASVPWAIDPGRVVVDLSKWQDLPPSITHPSSRGSDR